MVVVGDGVGVVVAYETYVVGLFAKKVYVGVVALLIGEKRSVKSCFAQCCYYAFFVVESVVVVSPRGRIGTLLCVVFDFERTPVNIIRLFSLESFGVVGLG